MPTPRDEADGAAALLECSNAGRISAPSSAGSGSASSVAAAVALRCGGVDPTAVAAAVYEALGGEASGGGGGRGGADNVPPTTLAAAAPPQREIEIERRSAPSYTGKRPRVIQVGLRRVHVHVHVHGARTGGHHHPVVWPRVMQVGVQPVRRGGCTAHACMHAHVHACADACIHIRMQVGGSRCDDVVPEESHLT